MRTTAKECNGKTSKEKAEWLADCLKNHRSYLDKEKEKINKMLKDWEYSEFIYQKEMELLHYLQKKALKEISCKQ